MSDKDRKELLERVEQLNQEFINAPYWVMGSVIETTRKQSKKEIPFYYLSQSVNGKTKTTYISLAKLQAFKKAAAEGQKLKETLSEIGKIHVSLLKGGGGHAQ